MKTIEYLESKTGKRLGQAGNGRPTMLDLVDEIIPQADTPEDVLLAIVGKALIKEATMREWSAFKELTARYGEGVDQAIEIRTFVETHTNVEIIDITGKNE